MLSQQIINIILLIARCYCQNYVIAQDRRFAVNHVR
jgi:hypothetical protein